MTQVKGFYTPQLAVCTTNSTTFNRGDDPFLPRISGGDLLANTKYLIVARGVLVGDNTNILFSLRVNANETGGLIAAKSEQVIEPFGTTRSYPYFFVHEFDTDGTPGDIDMEMKTGNSSNTASVDQCSLKAVDLVDLGASNWTSTISADDSGEYPTTQADEWTIPGSSLGTDEHLILAYQRTGIGATNREYRVQAFAAADTSTSAVRASDQNEGEDGNELRISGFQLRHKASSGTPNFSIQTWELDTNTNALDRGGYGIAIKFSAFEKIEWDYEAGTTVIDSTERTMATITYSPTTTADHILFGSITMTVANGGEQHLHIEDDTVEMRVGDQPITYGVKYDPSTSIPVLNLFHQDNILSSDTSTYDLRGATNDADDDLAEHRWLIIWSLELSAGGTAHTATPTEAVGVTDETPIKQGKVVAEAAGVGDDVSRVHTAKRTPTEPTGIVVGPVAVSVRVTVPFVAGSRRVPVIEETWSSWNPEAESGKRPAFTASASSQSSESFDDKIPLTWPIGSSGWTLSRESIRAFSSSSISSRIVSRGFRLNPVDVSPKATVRSLPG